MKTQEHINELIRVCHKASREKGFWDKPRNQDEAFALILSELFEAFEAHRKGKFADMKQFQIHLQNPIELGGGDDEITDFKNSFLVHIKDTVDDEIADTFIRLFDYCGGFEINLTYLDLRMEMVITDNFGRTLVNILMMITPSYSSYAHLVSLTNLYYFLILIVEKYGIDIEKHIELKLKYNATRGYKHGKQY